MNLKWRIVSDSSLTMNDAIMISLQFYKIINVFSNFLIPFEGKIMELDFANTYTH